MSSCRSFAHIAVLVVALIFTFGGVGAAQELLYFANSSGPTDFYELDLSDETPTVRLVTQGQGSSAYHGIAICPGINAIFGIGKDPANVIGIDLDSQQPAAVILGELPVSFTNRAVQATCSADGTIYFTDVSTETLYRLGIPGNPCPAGTCTPVLIGTVETSPKAGDVDLSGGDIAFSPLNELYMVTNSPVVTLYRVDQATALAAEIGTMNIDIATGLVFTTEGRMVVSSREDDTLYEVDVSDASLVSLGTPQVVVRGQRGTFDIQGGDLAALKQVCPPTLDFEVSSTGEKLAIGTIIDDQYQGFGFTITTNDPQNHPAMIFDSAAPTGDDADLGTPNSDFGGPGIGGGGHQDQAGRNGLGRGKILIISEDGDMVDPDDNASGGTISFTFDPPVPLIQEVHILDYDIGKGDGGVVRATDEDGNVTVRPILELGSNSFQAVPLGVRQVATLEVVFPGSGAVAGVVFCGTCGANVPEDLANR